MASAAFSLVKTPLQGDNTLSPLFSSSSSVSSRFSIIRIPATSNKLKPSFVVLAANSKPMTGVVFEPFEEVKKELLLVPTVPQASLARQKYADECEAAINEQINVEYNVSYAYHALFAYFDRDNVALRGFAKFFKESSEEEREHAEKFMKYQNKRGGRVRLQSIVMPLSDFDHAEKGDALYGMELALSLEKLTNEKLLNLHNVKTFSLHLISFSNLSFNSKRMILYGLLLIGNISRAQQIACKNNDAQLADFVESEFLTEQVETIKKISEFVAQLRRVGKGHGVWHFDQMLLHEGEEAIA
ncbi:Ferritin/DPS protein domain [Dillenia turbinata]|uniref:Ferritin n=1 Tax=Dillenia turbinata TaxID=194707 RepID=A0AAN8V8K4_9MAGN